jgi:tetratricopeptide (TPR) repeat protein
LLAWHGRQAHEAETGGRLFAAAFHLSRVIAAVPGQGALYLRRGRAMAGQGQAEAARADLEKALKLKATLTPLDLAHVYAELGRWKEAGRIMELIVNAPGAPANAWARHLELRLKLGDRDGYRAACATIVKRFGTASPSWSLLVPYVCAFEPGALPDLAPAVAVARKLAPGQRDNAYFHAFHGALLVRAGDARAALAELAEDARLQAQTDVMRRYFLVLAHSALGQGEEAKKALKEAVEADEKAPPGSWHQRLERQRLRAEAEKAVGAGP